MAATSRDAQHTPAFLREPPEVPAGHDQRQAAPALLRAQRNPTVRGEFQPAERGPASAVPEPGAACRFLLPGQILANLKRLGALATCTRSGPEGTRLSWAVLIPNWGWLFGRGEDLFNAWKRSIQMISLLRPSLDSFHKEKKPDSSLPMARMGEFRSRLQPLCLPLHQEAAGAFAGVEWLLCTIAAVPPLFDPWSTIRFVVPIAARSTAHRSRVMRAIVCGTDGRKTRAARTWSSWL